MFAICICARFQSCPKESHLTVIKCNFQYLTDNPKLGLDLFYLRGVLFDLIGYSDADFAGCKLDRKTTSTRHFLITH